MSSFNKAPFDAENSTYKQVIYLPRGNSLTGYSKRINFEEAKNKVNLLTNWICRNYKLGYLDKDNITRDTATQIDYFWKTRTGGWEHFIRLYPNYCEWYTSHQRESIDNFLKQFYECMGNGQDPYKKLYVHAKSKTVSPLDYSFHRFRSLHFLRAHCADLVQRNVRTPGEVKHFYVKYMKVYFNQDFSSDDERFFNLLIN